MEALIKKTVKRTSRPMLKATNNLTKSDEVFQQATFTAEDGWSYN